MKRFKRPLLFIFYFIVILAVLEVSFPTSNTQPRTKKTFLSKLQNSPILGSGLSKTAASHTNESKKDDLNLLRAQAETGDPKAQLAIGVRYIAKGIQDQGEALIRKAAKQGDVEAQMVLISVLLEHQEDPAKMAEARHWAEEAAKQGDASAQYLVGLMYCMGVGGPQDTKKAYEHVFWSANAGYPHAEYLLAAFYFADIGGKKNDVEAAKWFERSQKHGIKDLLDIGPHLEKNSQLQNSDDQMI